MNRRIHFTALAQTQRHIFILAISVLTALVLIGCGGNPMTVRELEGTAQASATERVQEATTLEENRIKQLKSLAPAGTVVSDTAPGGDHDEGVRYEFGILPPNGGAHHPQWQKCDIYEAPVPTHHAIHAMEHGGVWIAYNPSLSEDGIDELRGEARGESFVLMAPYPDLPSPVVLTAWGVQLELDDPNDSRVREFVRTFANGVQTPEPGANCVSGVQTTVES